MRDLERRIARLERVVLAESEEVSAKEVYDLAMQEGGRIPDFEDVVMKDPKVAVLYARDVLRSPWPKAEAYIKQDAEASFMYAKYVIRGRWEEGESVIKRDPQVKDKYLNLLS